MFYRAIPSFATRLLCLTLLVGGLLANPAFSAEKDLEATIKKVIAPAKAEVGVGIKISGTGDAIVVNDAFYPLMSVFKYHLALAVLDQVDRGKLSLDQKIFIGKDDLPFEKYSTLRQKYEGGNVHVPLSEIITETVAQSDNNGCDIMLRLIGGSEALEQYLQKIGVKDVKIAASEQQMHISLDFIFTNTATPGSVVHALELFDQGKILTEASRSFLRKVMEGTTTGANRIKGLLPAGTVVAHKTGSGPRKDGAVISCGDVGIVTLPDGRHLIIAVFVANAPGTDQENDRIMAEVSKAAWDYYTAK